MLGACTFSKNGVLGRIRTCDTRFRKPILYPTELRGLMSYLSFHEQISQGILTTPGFYFPRSLEVQVVGDDLERLDRTLPEEPEVLTDDFLTKTFRVVLLRMDELMR